MTDMVPLGQRIRTVRKRRAMSQHDLAAAAGIAVDTVRKLEQGQRHTARIDTLARIATALDHDVAELIGKPRGLVVTAEDDEIVHIRRAVLDVLPVAGDPPGRDTLRWDLGEAWRLYWAGRYAPLVRVLPAGIVAARVGVRAASDSAGIRQANEVMADYLHLTASVLAHLAHGDLAALAMHQALAAAHLTGEPLLVAGLAASRVWLLARQGLTAEAERLAFTVAADIEPRMGEGNVDRVAIWGEILRYGCVALARGGRLAEAAELLPRLRAAAARVDAERPARPWSERVNDKAAGVPLAGLGFGRALAAMTAVTVAAAGDRNREALRLERQVPHVESVAPVMRCRHLLTVAWSQMVEYRSAESVSTLLYAERLAPGMLPHQTIARAIVAELLPRRARQALPGLVALAERLGVPVT